MTAVYTNHPATPVAQAIVPAPASPAPPVYIKTERLNMIRRSVPLDAPLPSLSTPNPTPAPEPVASPIHMTITKFCRDHNLNARLQYLPPIDFCYREPSSVLAERLLGCLAAVIDQEIGLFDTPPSPSYLVPLHAEQLDRNLIVAADSIHGDRDSHMPDLVNMQAGLRAYTPSRSCAFHPSPHRSAEEYAHRAAWSRYYIDTHTADSAGLVFNLADQHYYRQIIYGGNAVPVSDYCPQQEILQAVLCDTADHQLATCRLHNNEFPGTFLVASLLPDAPARFFGQPLTDISMLQVYQEHHDLEYEILKKAKSEQELRYIIYNNNIYTYNLSTTLNIRKVQDRLRHDELCRPITHPVPSTSDVHIVSGLVYDDDEASATELHAIVAGAQLVEDDEPPRPARLVLPLDAAIARRDEFERDIEYKSDTEIAMSVEAETLTLPSLAEPAPTDPVPDPQPTCPPDMPPPDPTLFLFPSPYLADELYNGDFSDSALTTLYTIDSSYYSDGDLPDHNDDYYDDYYDDMPDYYDQLSHTNELPRFNSYPASDLTIPFLSSAGTAAADIEVPHPCIFSDALHFMEMTPAEAETEYLTSLLSHMCPEFIVACPEAVELMQTLGLEVFVPKNWDGARIDALKLRFSPDFTVTLHARLIPVNPRLYAHAKKEFDRFCQYHLVPSDAPYSSNLVIAPKETASVATTSLSTSIYYHHNTLSPT